MAQRWHSASHNLAGAVRLRLGSGDGKGGDARSRRRRSSAAFGRAELRSLGTMMNRRGEGAAQGK